MKWSVHPAKKQPTKTITSLILIFAFIVFISVVYGPFWGLFGLIVLFFSVYSYYFPTHYEVDGDEVMIKNIFVTQHRKLREFKKVYQGKNGVLLSPFTHKTFLNQFRGVFLLLPENRDEIINYLKEIIHAPQGSPHSDAQKKDSEDAKVK